VSDKVIDGQKEATVSNGRRLRIRAVRPTDKQKLLHGFENLSSESRYLRFLVHKNGLTQEELRFFTELDGINHYALAVLELDSQSQEGDCIGVARLIRVPDDANVGEVALVVTDTSQHKGIGRLLLQRLLNVAAVQGIRRVRFFCLPYNEPIRRLIKHVFEDATLRNEDGLSTGEFDIPAHVRLSVSSL
jgi:RimJ/RimL family protein N-acetyltransferase